MVSVKKQLLQTLLYADVFDYPLTHAELWRYVIGNKLTVSSFQKALSQLKREKRIGETVGYVHLYERTSTATLRKKRQMIAHKKYRMLKRYIRIFSFIPTVWFVGVSGALAMENAPEEDDIDLFIITAPGTVWLTRFLATIFLDILHLRRKPGDMSFSNKLCLNMYLDSSRLSLPKREHDLYSAHEIVQLKPMLNRHQTYERFMYANFWVTHYLPHAIIVKKTILPKKKVPVALIYVERWVKKIQLLYMRNRRSTEVITTFFIKFHPHDARQRILTTYAASLKKYFRTKRT